MNKGFQLHPDQASTFAPELDLLYFFVVIVSTFFLVLIAVLIYAFAVKYRRRSDDERPDLIHGSLPLEIAWSVIPLALMMIMFGWGTWLFFKVYQVPEGALEINVVGKQWMWHIQHPTGQREINEMHMPIGRPIKLTMASEDVIHDFYIPEFRVKNDVIPGRYTTMTFEASKTGEFYLFCAEYCGTEHSRMVGRIIVLEDREYQDWLAGGVSDETPEEAGARLFSALNCVTCHGDVANARGPALTGLFGEEISLTTGQRVIMNEEYIRESVLSPRAKIVAGYPSIMPTYQGQITEANLLNIVAYIKSLRTPTTAQE